MSRRPACTGVSTLKKITINDVAESAGVSVTTVSLVLSGKGRISSDTAQRVNQAIEHLGYVRNRSAASLRSRESGVIGVVVRDLTDAFYAEVIAGLGDTLEKHDKLLFLTQSGRSGQHLRRCFESLLAQGVDGIVLAGGAEHAATLIEQAQEQGVPLISATRASSTEGIDAVRPDNMQAARLATEYLIRRGHHTIAWLGGNGASLTRAERIGGYCTTLMQYSLPFRSDWILECDSDPQQAAEYTETLIHQHPNISAILCHNASIALGCYFGLMRSGRGPGKEAMENYFERKIALVGFGDGPEANLTDPPLTVVNSSAREIGVLAARRLLQRLQEPTSPSQSIIVPPEMIVRGSA
ncbi:Mal regulon transcriptional regulator MalI [Enterobacterales bacterium CwR94]|nr:Mal regulon transcriptional regulator MalI [Enterobacterales bacterium CwR94]